VITFGTYADDPLWPCPHSLLAAAKSFVTAALLDDGSEQAATWEQYNTAEEGGLEEPGRAADAAGSAREAPASRPPRAPVIRPAALPGTGAPRGRGRGRGAATTPHGSGGGGGSQDVPLQTEVVNHGKRLAKLEAPASAVTLPLRTPGGATAAAACLAGPPPMRGLGATSLD
jgi:hypothetical protein